MLTGLIRRIVPGTSVHAVDTPGADGIWLPVVTGRRAVVTGFGVLSPVGLGADATGRA